MVEYDTPMKGQRYIQEVKKQIQRDIYAYLEPRCDAGIHKRHRQQALQIALSQIVIDNFKIGRAHV